MPKNDFLHLNLGCIISTEQVAMEEEFPSCLAQKHASILRKVFSEAEFEADDLFTWIVEGVLILIAFLVGLFGNSFSIVIFSRQKVHRIFHHLLLLLAIFDMVSNNLYHMHKIIFHW